MSNKSNKLKDMANFIERRKLERLEKTKQREALVRKMKLERVKSLETITPAIKLKNKPASGARRNSQAPVVRQTLTSKKRIDIINLNLPEYEEIKKKVFALKSAPNCNDYNAGKERMNVNNVTDECNTSYFNDIARPNACANENIIDKPQTSNSNDNVSSVLKDINEITAKATASSFKNDAGHNMCENENKVTQHKTNSQTMQTYSNENDLTKKNVIIMMKPDALLKENKIVEPIVIKKSIKNVSNRLSKSRKQWGSPKPMQMDSLPNLQPAVSSEAVNEISLVNNKAVVKMRRSISSIHRKKLNIEEARKCIRRSQSMRALSTPIPSIIEENQSYFISKISVMPSTSSKTIMPSTPKPADLQKRLMKWLQSHGKSLSNFKNLHMFGINKSLTTRTVNQNKENIPVMEDCQNIAAQKLNETFEKISESEIIHSTPKIDNGLNPLDLIAVEGILKDLYVLIIDGYPKEQCEQWLEIIKHQYKALQNLPIFWECKAILQSNDGDFQSAIESYQKAVAEGAEQINIEDKLSSLFDKLCDLNIDPKTLNAPAIVNLSLNLDINNRNRFASSIIKFAVRKNPKARGIQETSEYIATPVRRSSRLWAKTPLSTTPFQKVQYCNTLNSLDDNVRKSIKFTPNSALDTP